MKKIAIIFGYLLFVAFAMEGCKAKLRCWTEVYNVVNQIESDITIELRFGEGYTTVIKPGHTKTIYCGRWCQEEGLAGCRSVEMLPGTMKIGGETVNRKIWFAENWEIDNGPLDDDYAIYTLTVTDELLEKINTQTNDDL